jgi:anti-sigma factor RsiW
MDHSEFKARRIAADYVADGLDEQTQTEFELHMMDCSECVDDVEAWRAIKLGLSAAPAEVAAVRPARRPPAVSDWRMAASLLGAGVVGATGGWVARSNAGPSLDAAHTVVFNLPAVTRGAEDCLPVRLNADTRLALLRVSGLDEGVRLAAIDAAQHELPSRQYAVQLQPDGSQLVRIDSQLLRERTVELQTKSPDGKSEPLACVRGETPPRGS